MSKLKEVALGALLHDIGKIKILNDKKLLGQFNNDKEIK